MEAGHRVVVALPDTFLERRPRQVRPLLDQVPVDDHRFRTVRPLGLVPATARDRLREHLGAGADSVLRALNDQQLAHPLTFALAATLDAGPPAGGSLSFGDLLVRQVERLMDWSAREDGAQALNRDRHRAIIEGLALQTLAEPAGRLTLTQIQEQVARAGIPAGADQVVLRQVQRSLLRHRGEETYTFLHDAFIPQLAAASLARELGQGLDRLARFAASPQLAPTLALVVAGGGAERQQELARQAARAGGDAAVWVTRALAEGGAPGLDQLLSGPGDRPLVERLRGHLEAAVHTAAEQTAAALEAPDGGRTEASCAGIDLRAFEVIHPLLRYAGSPLRPVLFDLGAGKEAFLLVRASEQTTDTGQALLVVQEEVRHAGIDLTKIARFNLGGHGRQLTLLMGSVLDAKVKSLSTPARDHGQPLAHGLLEAVEAYAYKLYAGHHGPLWDDLAQLLGISGAHSVPGLARPRLEALEKVLAQQGVPVVDALLELSADLAPGGPLEWIVGVAGEDPVRARRLLWLYLSCGCKYGQNDASQELYSDLLLGALCRCIGADGELDREALGSLLEELPPRLVFLRQDLLGRIERRRLRGPICTYPGHALWPEEVLDLVEQFSGGDLESCWMMMPPHQHDLDVESDITSYLDAVAGLMPGRVLGQDRWREQTVGRLVEIGVLEPPSPQRLATFCGSPDRVTPALVRALGGKPARASELGHRLTLLLQEDDAEGALSELQQAAGEAGEYPAQEGFWLARWLVARDHEGGLALAREVAGHGPSERSCSLLVTCLRSAGRHAEALQEARLAIQRWPENLLFRLEETICAATQVVEQTDSAGLKPVDPPPGPERVAELHQQLQRVEQARELLRKTPADGLSALLWEYSLGVGPYQVVRTTMLRLAVFRCHSDLLITSAQLTHELGKEHYAEARGLFLRAYGLFPHTTRGLVRALPYIAGRENQTKVLREQLKLHIKTLSKLARRGPGTSPLERELLLRASLEDVRILTPKSQMMAQGARRLEQLGLHVDAARLFGEAAGQLPMGSVDRMDMQRLKADALMAAGRRAEALPIYQQLLEEGARGQPWSIPTLLELAELMVAGELPGGSWEPLSELLLQAAPQAASADERDRAQMLAARALLAEADSVGYRKVNRPVLERCLQCVEEVHQPEVEILRAGIMRRLDRPDEARQHLAQARQGEPLSLFLETEWWLVHAELSDSLGHQDQAEQCFALAAAHTHLAGPGVEHGRCLSATAGSLLYAHRPGASAVLLQRLADVPERSDRDDLLGLRALALSLARDSDAARVVEEIPDGIFRTTARALLDLRRGLSPNLLIGNLPAEVCPFLCNILSPYLGDAEISHLEGLLRSRMGNG